LRFRHVEDLRRKGFGGGKNHKKAATRGGLKVILAKNRCAKTPRQK